MELKNVKWERFCVEYAKSGNAPQSYKKAGYKAKTENSINTNASRLLKNATIQARLAELREETHRESIATIAEIQETLTAIMRGDVKEQQIVVEGCGDGISEAVVKERAPQLKDQIKAGETLAKMFGAFDNSVKVNLVVPVIGGEDDLSD